MGRFEVIGLDGKTSWVELDAAAAAHGARALRAAVAGACGVPGALLRLKHGACELADGDVLPDAGAWGVRVMLRLDGGKGGFGAMLRTSGKGGVKTTNFDACRDMNGRRLRHVNAEAKIREWEANAAERQRKKQEQLARDAPPEKIIPRFDDDAYEESMEAARRSVSDALAAAASSDGAGSSDAANGAGAAASDAAPAAAPSGKRRAAEVAEPAPKVAKVAYDPLASMLGGGDGDDSSSSSDGD